MIRNVEYPSLVYLRADSDSPNESIIVKECQHGLILREGSPEDQTSTYVVAIPFSKLMVEPNDGPFSKRYKLQDPLTVFEYLEGIHVIVLWYNNRFVALGANMDEAKVERRMKPAINYL